MDSERSPGSCQMLYVLHTDFFLSINLTDLKIGKYCSSTKSFYFQSLIKYKNTYSAYYMPDIVLGSSYLLARLFAKAYEVSLDPYFRCKN